MLRELGVRPRKSWGQHFLADGNVLRRIVVAAEVVPGDRVLEIGPGLGSLTEALLAAGASVVAVERDPLMVRSLEALEGDLLVVEADFLRYALSALVTPYKVVANLPYYVTSPILERLLPERPQLMILMMQTEVARRLTAPPGTKEYSSLTLFASYYADIELMFKVSASCFFPPPEVESAVVRFRPVAPRLDFAGEKRFRAFLRAGFGTRRKTLRNSLSRLMPAEELSALGMDPNRRAETLSLDEFLRLAQATG